MKEKILYTLLISLIFTFAGCSDVEEVVDSPYTEGVGGLNLKARASTEEKIPVITKSADFSGIVSEDLYITILDVNGKTVYNPKKYSEMVEGDGLPIILPVGEYTAIASSYVLGETKVSTIPYFEGKFNFGIEEKKTTNVPITSRYQSLGVELILSERFKSLIEAEPNNYDYEVSASNGEASCTFSQTNMKPAYFVSGCDSLVVRVKVRLGSDLWYPERVYWVKNNTGTTVTSPKVNEYYIINLDAGEEVETLSFRASSLTVK